MNLKRIIILILILIWMITVFNFSSENAGKSSQTSGKIIERIIEVVEKEINEEEKMKKVENLQSVVRKGAHVTLYAIGGILLFLFCDTYDILNTKKILYSISIGILYAASDEIHQYFVPGRSMQITDVLIDTGGIMIGIGIILVSVKLLKLENMKEVH